MSDKLWDRARELIRPVDEVAARNEFEEYVEGLCRLAKGATAVEPERKRRQNMIKATDALYRASIAIGRIDHDLLAAIGLGELEREMRQASGAIAALRMKTLPDRFVTKSFRGKKYQARSAGSASCHELKHWCAHMAFSLIRDCGGREPTLAQGRRSGSYFYLANLLFEVATGRADVDLTRACRTVHQRRRTRAEPKTSRKKVKTKVLEADLSDSL
jgi:hypothetical protein